ncbi:MAG: RNA pseudouridine synthase [Muribaculaceae bacterium]|nr:RNA pseudouridine synthase [Muribaculaceae bacterium]
MKIVYEDNHLLVVDKSPGEIVQGDKTGDKPLLETLKDYLKEKYNKPGNVFLGLVHRLDRPVGGLVIFAKTSKALSRLNEMLRKGEIKKKYYAITRNRPPKETDELVSYLVSREKNNKTYLSTQENSDAKEARLIYKLVNSSDNYYLLEIELLTGRKHQIRVQLSSIGVPIRGDLKYGDKRSNHDGSISLLSHQLDFIHPVSKQAMHFKVDCPDDNLWKALWI